MATRQVEVECGAGIRVESRTPRSPSSAIYPTPNNRPPALRPTLLGGILLHQLPPSQVDQRTARTSARQKRKTEAFSMKLQDTHPVEMPMHSIPTTLASSRRKATEDLDQQRPHKKSRRQPQAVAQPSSSTKRRATKQHRSELPFESLPAAAASPIPTASPIPASSIVDPGLIPGQIFPSTEAPSRVDWGCNSDQKEDEVPVKYRSSLATMPSQKSSKHCRVQEPPVRPTYQRLDSHGRRI
ncbi:hypothetical protein BKA62DRAFT_390820 [Auriculariales sp. MPI-PUGE-AT-0066]|nr:hypothetical protein BKA62DRAFT_390820 [Auriculariales sp. MPI-PUGE-AT-0066]